MHRNARLRGDCCEEDADHIEPTIGGNTNLLRDLTCHPAPTGDMGTAERRHASDPKVPAMTLSELEAEEHLRMESGECSWTLRRPDHFRPAQSKHQEVPENSIPVHPKSIYRPDYVFRNESRSPTPFEYYWDAFTNFRPIHMKERMHDSAKLTLWRLNWRGAKMVLVGSLCMLMYASFSIVLIRHAEYTNAHPEFFAEWVHCIMKTEKSQDCYAQANKLHPMWITVLIDGIRAMIGMSIAISEVTKPEFQEGIKALWNWPRRRRS